MKINKLLQNSGIGLATFMALAFSANHAQALDFEFSGISAPIFNNPTESISVDGTISIDDSAIPSSTSNPLEIGDITDWEININNSATGGSDTLNQSNSFLNEPDPANNPFSGTADSSDLEISGFCFSGTENCATGGNKFSITDNFYAFRSGNNASTGTPNTLGRNVPAPISATAVPFGASTDLSLLILGGMWGVSRLRKKIATKS